MATPIYNRVIRKLVIGFGNLFDDITLVRYNPNNTEAERFIVPIAYAAKELYVQRLLFDPDLDKKVAMSLPRMSFEMTGMIYDVTRKQNTNTKNFTNTSSGVAAQYNPVPYNFDFSLYLYVRNTEDGTQLLEHIIPFFTPDYTIKLNLIPDLGVIKEVPVILNNVSSEIDYEGDRNNPTRMIIWTLNFTVKGFIFGSYTTPKLIRTSITNILNDISASDIVLFNLANTGVGQYQAGEIVYQGYTPNISTATAKVVRFNSSNNVLHLTNINGNFVSSSPIIGANTNSNYVFNTYEVQSVNLAQIVTTPTPTDASANDKYNYTTTITETFDIDTNVISAVPFNTDLMLNIYGIDDLHTQQANTIDLGS
jgi:hypothetical protein